MSVSLSDSLLKKQNPKFRSMLVNPNCIGEGQIQKNQYTFLNTLGNTAQGRSAPPQYN